MVDVARGRKLAHRIKTIVAETLPHLADPGLNSVTITDARITGDLRDATVFYTVLGDETAVRQAGNALKRATGLLRTAVGEGTGVKFTPSLAFSLDAVPEQAQSIDDLLEKARLEDERVHGIAATARHAGDPDPYE